MPLPGLGQARGFPQVPGMRSTCYLLLPANTTAAQGWIRRGPYTAYRVPETSGLTIERVGAGGVQVIAITDHWYLPEQCNAIEQSIVQDMTEGQNFQVFQVRAYAGRFIELLTKSSNAPLT